MPTTMVLRSKPIIEQYSYVRNCLKPTLYSGVPLIDLSKPNSDHQIVKACEDFGFFKVINHGISMESITNLESIAVKFFSLPLSQKEKIGHSAPLPLVYGNKSIGPNGDIGWVEYLLFTTNIDSFSQKLLSSFGENPEKFRSIFKDYISAVRKVACKILELMADGLKLQPSNLFSKLLMDEQSDSIFRLNHYPPCPELQAFKDANMIGFGEHTDPQIISVLRSNNTSGLQISLRDGNWISVPPDPNSFFVNVGDSLQVMTNGRFQSVRHRVLANSLKSRVSMVYFGGPPLSEKIAPLPSLVKGDKSLYKKFTWFDYKKFAYKLRLADNRLENFKRIAAS